MAHGITFNSSIKHGDIIDFKFVNKPMRANRDTFRRNYDFIWQIYNHVAEQNGIKIPYFWVDAERIGRRHRYTTHKKNASILEPIGPTLHVNYSYSLQGILNADAELGSVMVDFNWYKQAENFFMVAGSAKHAMQLAEARRFRPGLMCEKWRAIKIKALTQRP